VIRSGRLKPLTISIKVNCDPSGADSGAGVGVFVGVSVGVAVAVGVGVRVGTKVAVGGRGDGET
jgi:hypothetical protein